MHAAPGSGFDLDGPADERVDALAARVRELEDEIGAAVVAGDGKKLKELGKVLDAWAKHDPKLEERVTNKVEVLGERFDMLAERVDTLVTTVATTAAGLSGREGELAALRRTMKQDNAAVAATVAELRQRVDPKPLLDLGEKVKAISDQSLALKRGLQRLSDAFANKTDLLGQRVEALGSSLSGLETRERQLADLRIALEELTARTDTTAARVAARESELASLAEALGKHESAIGGLRADLSKTSTHVEAAVGEFRRTVNSLTSKVTRLDEEASPEAVRALNDQVAKLGAHANDSARRLDVLASEVRTTAERDAESVAELAQLRRRLDEGDVRVPALDELREALGSISLQLSELEGAASGETVRELEQSVASARSEVEAVALRVRAMETAVSELDGRENSRAAHLDALSCRFDEGRERVETLVGDLQEAIDTMPTASGPDPELVASVNATSERLAILTTQLEWLQAQVQERAERVEARQSKVERLVAEGTGRLSTLESEGVERAAGVAREVENTTSRIHSLEARLQSLASAQGESVEASRRLTDVVARLDELEAERGAAAEEVARVSGAVETAISSVRDELSALGEAARHATEARGGRLAEIGERLEALEREQAAGAAEATQAAKLSAAEREWARERLDGMSSAQAEAAAAAAAVEESLEGLAERVDDVQRSRESAAGEIADLVELVSAERAALRSQLDTLAKTLADQASRRSDHSDALYRELEARLDAVERASVSATSEVERLAAQSAAYATIVARLDDTAVVPADSDTRSAVAELADRLEEALARLASIEESGTTASRETSDGRLRLELRGLEIRVDHAEAAAREHREAVLAELERLSSQTERRGQPVEARGVMPEESAQVETPIGDVLPFRTEA